MTKNDKTIQEKMDQLNTLVDWFSSDEFTLEEALDRFQAAQQLAGDIEQDLTKLKNEIEIVKQRFDTETNGSR